ncbi:Low temperature requirement protein A [Sphingomonas antarctica]|uniref:low temperature requirement protein A n=1 Tax=Sphingomonas antarctica TaxID=2040274 RepID=UPI0039EC741A
MADKRGLFRAREAEDSHRVTNIELFFDLVFVFAVTQLSHRLLTHLDWFGAVETLVLFLALWWLWMYTSWTTNWMDPERGPVRAMLIAMMLGALLLAVWLPGAFVEHGWQFALVYVAMQIGRTAMMIVSSVHARNRDRARNFLRIVFYFVLSAPLWIAGGFADAAWRLPLWAGALAVEYAGPFVFFATPVLGRSKISDWDISGAHMAERVSLFVIIALGEAIVVTGNTFATLDHPDMVSLAAFVISFLSSAAMWWVYFDSGARRAGEVMERADVDAGRLGRDAYTYWHMPIVAGIVVTAVGDELILAHPHAMTSTALIWTAGGGTLLFLLGNLVFKWITVANKYPPLSHGVGLFLLAIALAVAPRIEALTFGVAMLGVLVATAMWEWGSLNGGWERWAPGLGHRLGWPDAAEIKGRNPRL